MAALMTASMIIVEVLWMGDMYNNRKANAFVIGGSVAALVLGHAIQSFLSENDQ